MLDEAPSREAAIELMSAPGKDFELLEMTINGSPARIFKNAPATIRDLSNDTLRFGKAEYLGFEDEAYTFADTHERAARLAHALVKDCGVKKGDRVAIGARNYPEWIITFLAITSVGGIAVCLNALWNSEELAYGLELTGSKLLIADRERIDRLADRLEDLDLSILSMRTDPYDDPRIRSLDDVMKARNETTYPDVSLDPDDDALIILHLVQPATPKEQFPPTAQPFMLFGHGTLTQR